MSKVRMAGFAASLLASALVGGAFIGSAAAAPNPETAPAAAGLGEPGASTYCQIFRAEFAQNLGVEVSALNAAGKAAAKTTVDEAVAAGDLTAAAGTRIKAKIDAAPGDACATWGAWAKRVEAGVHGILKHGVAAAADALSMTPAQLRTEMRAGKSLIDLAGTAGVPYASVSSAVVSAVDADLDKLVAAKRITQKRADRILARLEDNLADGWFRARP